MKNAFLITDVLSSYLEVFIMFIYFDSTFKKKERRFKLVFLLIGLMIFSSIFSLLELPSYINLLVTFFICYVILNQYIGSVTKKAYVLVLFLLIIVVSDSVTAIVLAFLFNNAYGTITNENITKIIGMVMTDFLIFIFSIYTSKVFNKKIKNLPIKYWLLLILCPIFSFILLQIFDYLLIRTQMTNLIIIILPIFMLIYINFTILDFFETYLNQMKLKVMEELAIKNEQNYKILEGTESEIRILKHDINNHILTMENLLLRNDTETAKKHLESLKDTAKKISYSIYTGNAALDSVLNIEGRKAHAENIDYTVKVCLKSDIFIEPADICTLFSNALDNAIDSCKNTNNRYIKTVIELQKDFITISIENSVNESKYSPSLTSTKEDKRNHGHGMKSIKNTIKKYNGNFSFNYKDNLFILNIILENRNLSK